MKQNSETENKVENFLFVLDKIQNQNSETKTKKK